MTGAGLSYLVYKLHKYDNLFVNIDNQCIANDIIDLIVLI